MITRNQSVISSAKKIVERRTVGDNLWLTLGSSRSAAPLAGRPLQYTVLPTEEAVGEAMFAELTAYAAESSGDINIVLLGGRGAQAMYRKISSLAETGAIDALLGRLNVFTQDALAPMRMDNGLSFVRDFERLLGPAFFEKIKSFTPMRTAAADLETSLIEYLTALEAAGGTDIFFLGLGPEADAASHLCYIKPGSGARLTDHAGAIPVSASIMEHHISKFRAGGSVVSEGDEAECRRATHIMTLGPAAILGARRIVQSIVDASTAPAKRESFKRLVETELNSDQEQLQRQTDENPGLLVRLHPDVRSYVLPDLLT